MTTSKPGVRTPVQQAQARSVWHDCGQTSTQPAQHCKLRRYLISAFITVLSNNHLGKMSNGHAVHHSMEEFVETLSWSVWYACSLPQCRSSLAPSHRTNQPVPPFSGLPLPFSLLGVPYNIHSAALCTLPDFHSHSSFTASATSAASTALHDLLVPAAPETSEYSGQSAEMVNSVLFMQILCFSQA